MQLVWVERKSLESEHNITTSFCCVYLNCVVWLQIVCSIYVVTVLVLAYAKDTVDTGYKEVDSFRVVDF